MIRSTRVQATVASITSGGFGVIGLRDRSDWHAFLWLGEQFMTVAS